MKLFKFFVWKWLNLLKKWTYFVCQRRIINGSDKRGFFILTYSSLAKRFRIRAVSDLFIVLQRLVLYIEYNWGVAILLRYWKIGTYFLRNIFSLIFRFFCTFTILRVKIGAKSLEQPEYLQWTGEIYLMLLDFLLSLLLLLKFTDFFNCVLN